MNNINDYAETIDYFLQYTEELSQLSRLEKENILFLCSSIIVDFPEQLEELKRKSCELLYQCCFHIDLDLKEIWNIYWILSYVLFSDINIKISGSLDELYCFIFCKIQEKIDDNYEPYEETDSNLIVMTISQFLGEQHAPSRRILDYAYAMITSLGKSVLILNDAGLCFYPCACLKQKYEFNIREEYNNITHFQYKDIEIPFVQLEGFMPDIYCMQEILDKIYRLRPELVYNIGGSSLLSDLCGIFTKTACFPCSTNIPVSLSQYLLVGRKILPSDAQRLERLQTYQQIIETVVNYQLPENGRKYTREEFGLKEEDFVICVVGNRLDKEIDEELLKIFNYILKNVRIHLLIIGGIKDRNKILDSITEKEKVHFTGRLLDANQLIKLTNLYYNPNRNGGGRSSFEALANGVPVLTLKHGDVYYTSGEKFGCDSYEEYISYTQRCLTDVDYYEELRCAARTRAEYLSDIAKTQGEILEKIL